MDNIGILDPNGNNINPLNNKDAKTTNNEDIIEPRSTPKNPLFQTSVIKFKKSSIIFNKYIFN